MLKTKTDREDQATICKRQHKKKTEQHKAYKSCG